MTLWTTSTGWEVIDMDWRPYLEAALNQPNPIFDLFIGKNTLRPPQESVPIFEEAASRPKEVVYEPHEQEALRNFVYGGQLNNAGNSDF